MYGYGHQAHHPVFGILLVVLVGALLVLAVLAVVRLWKPRPGHPGPVPTGAGAGPTADPALTELRMRYARGEITSDEYRQRVAGLGYPPPPGPGPAGPSSQPPAPGPTP